MFKLVFILAFSLQILQYVSAVCNVCNTNGIACINEKEFYMCANGNVNSLVKYSCPGENEICTSNGPGCMDKNLTSASPGCNDISNCGKCEGQEDNGRFTCTSRTTFTMCFNGSLTDIRSSCSKNEICDIGISKTKKYPCVPRCMEPKIKFCDLNKAIDVPVTTTVKPPLITTETTLETTTTTTRTTKEISKTTPKNVVTTKIGTTTSTSLLTKPPSLRTTTSTNFPPTTQNPPELFCANKLAVGNYPNPNDTTCTKFIFCFKRGGRMHTSFLECLDGLYFDPSIRICVNIKPKDCN